MIVQLLFTMYRVDGGDNAGKRIARGDQRHFDECMHDRRRISQARRFNDDALEIRDLIVRPLEIKIAQCLHHVTGN